MPGYADMQKSLAELKRQYANETKRSEEEFNQKYEAFLEGQKDFAPSILKKRQYELQELLNNSVSFKKEAARLLEQAEADMYAPLKKRLNEILRQVAASADMPLSSTPTTTPCRISTLRAVRT